MRKIVTFFICFVLLALAVPTMAVAQEPLSTPVVRTSVEKNKVTLSWDAVENAAFYELTANSNTPFVVNDTTYTYTGKYETEYVFSVVAKPADEAKFAPSLAGNAVAKTAKGELTISFWKLFKSGGWLMWVLVLLAGVMIFIFVERFIAIQKATTIDRNFMNRIRDFISEGNIDAAIDLCRRTNSPIARMVEKGIERIGRPMSDIQTSIENVANVEVAKLESGLPWLSSIAGGAPMIGFLGTVVGMVQVFMGMSGTEGAIELSQLSEGMYVAMVTTVGGLIVGIPAYFAYNYLVARIEKLIFRMEATTIAFMDILNQPVQK